MSTVYQYFINYCQKFSPSFHKMSKITSQHQERVTGSHHQYPFQNNKDHDQDK